jgi:hypothetical protein
MPAEALGHQNLDRLSEQFVPRMPEQPLGLRIDEYDAASLVDDDDGVRSGLEQPAELGFRTAPVREVTNRAADEEASVSFQGTQADFNRKLVPAFLETI